MAEEAVDRAGGAGYIENVYSQELWTVRPSSTLWYGSLSHESLCSIRVKPTKMTFVKLW